MPESGGQQGADLGPVLRSAAASGFEDDRGRRFVGTGAIEVHAVIADGARIPGGAAFCCAEMDTTAIRHTVSASNEGRKNRMPL